MKNRIMASLLIIAMLLVMLPITAAAEVTGLSGSGTEADPYLINNLDELKWFRDAVNNGTKYEGEYIKLTKNIDLQSVESWTPIGNDTNYFWGTFDGADYTISNMTININTPESNVFAGLFGGVKKATIKNLNMEDVVIDVVGAKVRAAAVAGIAHSNSEYRTDATINFENITVDGCTIDATATSSSALLGGVVGYSYPANMKNITVSDLTINGKAEGNEVRAAAINGYVCGQNISNNGNTRAPMLVDTFNVRNVTIAAEGYTVFAGGYAPYTYYGYITLQNGNINGLKINVVAHEAFVGGLVGYFWRSDNGHTVNNVDITNIDFDVTTDYLGETRIGGVVGTSQSPNTKYNDVTVSGKIVERCSDPANPVNYHAKVGGFVARTYEYALQTYTNCVADVDVTGSNVAGGFVGNHTSTVSYVNCEAKGDVTANIAGGFAGRLTNSSYTSAVTFDGCSASGAVSGTNVAGGFIGSTVSYGWNAWGTESAASPYAYNVTLTDCEATGTVTSGTDYEAGVVGEAKVADGKELILSGVSYKVEPPISPSSAAVEICASITDENGNTAYYTTLQAAINAAKDGETITVLADIDLAKTKLQVLDGSYDTYFLVEGKSVTVNLNGKTISGAYTGDSMLVGVFSTDKSGHLTLTGDGTVEVTATTTVYSLLVCYSDGSKITIENGTYKLDKASDNLIYYGGETDAAVTIKGGSFTLGNIDDENSPWIFNVKGAGDHHVLITGGTYNFDINRQKWSNEAVVAETCYTVNNGDGTWTVKDGAVAYVNTGMLTGPYFAPKNVGYATFEEAVAAANTYNDKPITLLKDIVITVPTNVSETTLDQNGKSISLSGNGSLTVADTSVVSPVAAPGYSLVTNQNDDGTITYSVKCIYTVTFDSNDGTSVAEQKIVSGEKATEPEVPTKTGYTFDGWYYTSEGSTAPTKWNFETDTVTSDVTLTAQWTAVGYTISYNLDGGTVGGSNPTSYKVTSDDITLINPTKTGYAFAGWTGTGLNAATEKVTISKGSTGDREYTATWTAKGDTHYTVNHWQQNIAGGAEENEINYTIADTEDLTGTTAAEIIPALKSYDGFTAPDTKTVTIAADGSTVVNYYYTRNSYTVTYKVNGEEYKVKTFKYGEEVTVPEYEAEEGYTFSGWDTPDTMPAEDIEINASYGNVYTITWSNGDGGGYDKNYTYGETITLPESEYFDETMRKPDYFITGWVNEEGYEVGDSMPAMNLTFTAQYTKDLSEEIFTTVMLLQLSGDNSVTMMPEKDVLGIGDALDLYQMQTMAPAARFVDVAASDWFHDSVISLANKGVVSGYPDGSFRPQGEVTWGEALKLVMKAVGYGDIDATNGHWASGFMAMAIEKGLIPGEVELDAAITRGEMADLTALALKLGEAKNAAPFADEAPASAAALYEAGIINGSMDNGQLLYRAESTITRAEMAAIIWRVYCAR